MSLLTKGASAQTPGFEPTPAKKGLSLNTEINIGALFRRKQPSILVATEIEMPRSPRTNLLPPEIEIAERQRARRRRASAIVIGVVVVVLAGTVGAYIYACQRAAEVASAERDSQRLNAQIAKLSDLDRLQQQLSTDGAAIKVGGSTDIDWTGYIQHLRSTLPSGVNLIGISAKSSGVTSLFEQGTGPLAQPRIGTLEFTATSSSPPSIPTWINALASLPGYAGATPESVVFDPVTKLYTATVAMDINTDAYSYKYVSKGAAK